jgi:hypothetical protein
MTRAPVTTQRFKRFAEGLRPAGVAMIADQHAVHAWGSTFGLPMSLTPGRYLISAIGP